MSEYSKRLDEKKIADFYNNIKDVWPSNEKWYKYTKSQIQKFVHKNAFKDTDYILNAGSGGYDYELRSKIHHVDIASDKISHLPIYTVASIESLPFASDTFDGILCVGCVINYCDAVAAISEMSRVLKSGGYLLLEYENSCSFEYKNKDGYKADAHIIKSVYQNEQQLQWIYSYKYINKILKDHRFTIMSTYNFHVFSAFMLYMGKNENDAAKYAKFDIICSHLPLIKNHSSNIIICCKKL